MPTLCHWARREPSIHPSSPANENAVISNAGVQNQSRHAMPAPDQHISSSMHHPLEATYTSPSLTRKRHVIAQTVLPISGCDTTPNSFQHSKHSFRPRRSRAPWATGETCFALSPSQRPHAVRPWNPRLQRWEELFQQGVDASIVAV